MKTLIALLHVVFICPQHATDRATFGVYVRRVPYSIVYGGLAAVIGLLIWMQLSALIIFLGVAWNAEVQSSRANRR